jgi:hypothetical protein
MGGWLEFLLDLVGTVVFELLPPWARWMLLLALLAALLGAAVVWSLG